MTVIYYPTTEESIKRGLRVFLGDRAAGKICKYRFVQEISHVGDRFNDGFERAWPAKTHDITYNIDSKF